MYVCFVLSQKLKGIGASSSLKDSYAVTFTILSISILNGVNSFTLSDRDFNFFSNSCERFDMLSQYTYIHMELLCWYFKYCSESKTDIFYHHRSESPSCLQKSPPFACKKAGSSSFTASEQTLCLFKDEKSNYIAHITLIRHLCFVSGELLFKLFKCMKRIH